MTLYILDTDHLTLQQQGHEPLKKRLSEISPDRIAITVISAEELLRGRPAQIHRAAAPEKRVQAYHWFHRTLIWLNNFSIMEYDLHAEKYFQSFQKQKIRTGNHDLKIAAVAVSRNATVVTRNIRDFERISFLQIEDWSG